MPIQQAQLKNAGYYELLKAYFDATDELAAYLRDRGNIQIKTLREKSDAVEDLIVALRPAYRKHLKQAGKDTKGLPTKWLPTAEDRKWLDSETARRKAIAAGNAPTRHSRPAPQNGKRAASNDSTADSSTED
jgi:hypothetical protein